jgi:YegS/Rv2252/BmrU family lipid kinase
MARRCHAVVNPRGGKHQGIAILEQVRPVFDAAGWDLAISVTGYPGHARELARTLPLDGYHGLCVFGGDGTVHEVVNGLMERGQRSLLPLGLIATGSANTLHQHLHCADPLMAARRIVAGRTSRLDVVRVTMGTQVVYSVDLIGWGSIADINCRAERWRFLGPSRYTAAALWQIVLARHRRAKVVLDSRALEGDFLFVIACNAKFAGKELKMAPRAELGDGKLDVVLCRRASRRQMLRLFAGLFDGSHVTLDCVEYHQVKSLAIESSEGESLDLDGEVRSHAPFLAEVLPGAMDVFT